MASVAPTPDQAANLVQKLSLDSQAKTFENPDAAQKPSKVNANNVSNGIQSDRSATPDPSMGYFPNSYPSPYYYSGYEGTGSEWEDYTRYTNPDGVEMTPGLYGDNGSVMYHGYGYAPYAPYSPATSPAPTMGPDGQLYGAQQYQYPTTYFQSLTGPYPNTAAPTKDEITPADKVPLSVDLKSNGIANGGGAKGNNGSVPPKPTYQNSSFNVNGSYTRGSVPASFYQDPRFGLDGLQSQISWLENPYLSDGNLRPVNGSPVSSSISNANGVSSSRNQNYRPHQTGMQNHMNTYNGYVNRMYSNKYGQYGNGYRSGVGYGANGYDSRSNGRYWMAVDNKYKPRGRGNVIYNYGTESIDGLNELNRGPRAKVSKNQKVFSPVALAVKGQANIPLSETTIENDKSSLTPDREEYNKPDFPETYADAKFFIIKSYSEDDVHKSIKYNVWSSTPNGNKKLDAAYQDAQIKSGASPVFLFFSVNTSGQFVGVAEMVGPVDFNKNVEYWQQDKWIGCFPVKWHLVKDVPNNLLKHIILENNENKPVTNSRDTQEVKLDQGLQVLKIFKDHTSKQCILDDFDFYEDRQKRIQEKKSKQLQFQKPNQIWGVQPTESKNQDGTVVGLASNVNEEVQTNGDIKNSSDKTN